MLAARCATGRRYSLHASNLKMSIELEVEFRKKQNAHVLCRSIVAVRPDPGGMCRHLVSPSDEISKFLLQILRRRECLFEDADKIIQCVRIPEEVIAKHCIARRTAKIDLSKVLVRFGALPFHSLNLLAEILEALPQRVQKKPCFFLLSIRREIEHRSREFLTSATKPEQGTQSGVTLLSQRFARVVLTAT